MTFNPGEPKNDSRKLPHRIGAVVHPCSAAQPSLAEGEFAITVFSMPPRSVLEA